MPELTQNRLVQDAPAVKSSAEEARVRSLRRLGQLAGEIESALKREDMGLICQASELLAPALAQWAETSSPDDAQNPAIARLTQEVWNALQACESALTHAMSDVKRQENQVRCHLKRVRQVRPRKGALSGIAGKTLNISP